MLDRGDATSVIDDAWDAVEQKTRLPEQLEAFLASRGPTPLHFDSRRAFHRFFMRNKAILERRESRFAVYTKDISRQGIGILTPVQLLPKERVQLRLANGTDYSLEIARCRRVDVGCYECGTRFVLQAQ
ncbi:MAG: PilZ domain-containing protein [Pirellulales bacterium]